MLNALEVRMAELPQDGVLSLVPNYARSLGVPFHGGSTGEPVLEATVRHYVSAFEGTNDSFDSEVLGVYRESGGAGANGREFLGYPPLGPHPPGHLRRSCEGSITIS